MVVVDMTEEIEPKYRTLIDGAYVGFVEWKGIPIFEGERAKNKVYFQIGYLVGVIAKYGLILYAGSKLGLI